MTYFDIFIAIMSQKKEFWATENLSLSLLSQSAEETSEKQNYYFWEAGGT